MVISVLSAFIFKSTYKVLLKGNYYLVSDKILLLTAAYL